MLYRNLLHTIKRSHRILPCLALLLLLAGDASAQSNPEAAAKVPELPDLTIPAEATLEQLDELISRAKNIRPASNEQYVAMQTAIRDASQQILKVLKKEPTSARYRQAELDTISSSILLMTFSTEDSKEQTLQQVHKYLRKRETLSLSDVQTGMMAAGMLEFQPDKRPARDTYNLLDELLEEDEREEMQALRVNLQANIRRLEMLGSKFVFAAETMDGQKFDVEQLKGKFVIVDFFATWCEPCLEEVPHIQKLLEKYQSKGLEVVGISLDEDAEALQKYLDKALLPWPIIHDKETEPMKRLQVRFGISRLPTVLLLNKEGVVVSLEAHGAELDRLMDMLFEAPTLAPAPEESQAKESETEQ